MPGIQMIRWGSKWVAATFTMAPKHTEKGKEGTPLKIVRKMRTKGVLEVESLYRNRLLMSCYEKTIWKMIVMRTKV